MIFSVAHQLHRFVLPPRHATLIRTKICSLSSIEADTFRKIVHQRKSCYRFQPHRRIDPNVLHDILKSTMRSPSSFNLQPTQIIHVQDPAIKNEIADNAMIGKGNQYRTKDCASLMIFCSDLQPSLRIQRILELERSHIASNESSSSSTQRHPDYLAMMPISTSFMLGEGHAATLLKQITMDVLSNNTQQPMPEIDISKVWAYKNTSLLIQTLVLAATSYNISSCIMEGFDPRKLKDIVHVPSERYGIPMVVALGYEYVHDDETTTNAEHDNNLDIPTARLNIDEVVFQDTFGVPIQLDDSYHSSNNDNINSNMSKTSDKEKNQYDTIQEC